MASNFASSAESLQRVSSELNSGREELQREVQQISAMVERLTSAAFKTPRASAAFVDRTKAWNRAVGELFGSLQDFSRAIDETRQKIDQADQRLTEGTNTIGDGAGGAR